jgi:hypothetical protein
VSFASILATVGREVCRPPKGVFTQTPGHNHAGNPRTPRGPKVAYSTIVGNFRGKNVITGYKTYNYQ